MIARVDPFEPSSVQGGADAGAEGQAVDLLAGPRSGGEITLRRLRIFWAVAHSVTLTRAGAQL